MRRINRISTVSAVSGTSIILCWQMRDTHKTQKINVHSLQLPAPVLHRAKYFSVLTFVQLFFFPFSCSLSLEQNFQFNLTSSQKNNFARKVGIQSHSLHDTLETSQYNFSEAEKSPPLLPLLPLPTIVGFQISKWGIWGLLKFSQCVPSLPYFSMLRRDGVLFTGPVL